MWYSRILRYQAVLMTTSGELQTYDPVWNSALTQLHCFFFQRQLYFCTPPLDISTIFTSSPTLIWVRNNLEHKAAGSSNSQQKLPAKTRNVAGSAQTVTVENVARSQEENASPKQPTAGNSCQHHIPREGISVLNRQSSAGTLLLQPTAGWHTMDLPQTHDHLLQIPSGLMLSGCIHHNS